MNANTNEQDDFEQFAWVAELRRGLAESESRIQTAELNDGWSLVHHRGRVIHNAMASFYHQVVDQTPPRGAFAIHAIGGTGRQEICPGSDVDVGIVVENVEENQPFRQNLSKQLRRLSPLVPGLRPHVKVNAFPDLKEIEHFDLKSLVSILDGDLLVGDVGFDRRIRRVCQQRSAELGLEFIFAINEDLRQFDHRFPQSPGDVGGFHVKDGIGGLRNFQMTMWLYSFERWISSVDVYQQVRSTRRFETEGVLTPDVLDAVSVLFSVRCWIEQRCAKLEKNDGQKRRSNLFIDVDDMGAFRLRFGAEGLTALNTARQTIRSYRHETWDRLREHGVLVPDTQGLVVWGADGLRIGADALFNDSTEMFYSIYLAQQRFGLSIDNAVKRAARKNIAHSLREHESLVTLMVASGPILPALEDWFDYGIMGRLIPGFSELANRLYEPTHRTATLTRAARAMQRIQNLELLPTLSLTDETTLEGFFVRQYRDLGDSARGALRFALLTEEIPQTVYGPGMPYAEAVTRYISDHLSLVDGLSNPTLRTIEFLLLTKRDLLEASEMGDQQQVLSSWEQQIAELDTRIPADTIRALALFTYAAFDYRNPKGVDEPRLQPEQWQNVQNLTQNLLYDALEIRGPSFQEHYFGVTGNRIGSLLPRRLLASRHVDNSLKQDYEGAEFLDPQRAHRIIHALNDVVQSGRPGLEIRRGDGYFRLDLFAWDFPGLFWRVAGAIHDLGCSVRSTDLYGIPDPSGEATDGEMLIPNERRLICDVLTFDAPVDVGDSWQDELKRRILQRLENPGEQIPDDTDAILSPVVTELRPRLTDLGNDYAKFSSHSPADNQGTGYAISRLLSERARASIESISQDGTRDWPIPRTNYYIRVPTDVSSVAHSLRSDLGDIPIIDDA